MIPQFRRSGLSAPCPCVFRIPRHNAKNARRSKNIAQKVGLARPRARQAPQGPRYPTWFGSLFWFWYRFRFRFGFWFWFRFRYRYRFWYCYVCYPLLYAPRRAHGAAYGPGGAGREGSYGKFLPGILCTTTAGIPRVRPRAVRPCAAGASMV